MDSKDVIAVDARPKVQIPLHQDVVLCDVGVDEAQLQEEGAGFGSLSYASSAAFEIAAASRRSALARPVQYCGFTFFKIKNIALWEGQQAPSHLCGRAINPKP